MKKGTKEEPQPTSIQKELKPGSSKLDDNEEEDIQEETRPKIYNKKRFYKNLYVVRHSLLDDFFAESTLNNSIFVGFYHLGMLLCAFFLITNSLTRGLQTGSIIGRQIFDNFTKDFWLVFSFWPICYIYSFIAFFLQKFVLMGLPMWIVPIVQHTSQSLMFLVSCYTLFSNSDWCTSHVIFCICHVFVHFMKMHSYTMVNTQLRREFLENQKRGKKNTSEYPANITIKNFNYFLWAPTLCYEASYPRSPHGIRKLYLLKKLLFMVGCLLFTYIVAVDYVLPVVEEGNRISMVEKVCRLLAPMLALQLTVFFFMFENFLNFFAEITRFGDRQFYQDFWNSSTWDEFNRKWNRVVHEFLFRHVYLYLIDFKLSLFWSQFITFLFSAALHELVFVLIFKKFRPVLFGFMLFQIPLIATGHKLKGTSVGNYIFWFGLIFGVPWITSIYLEDEEISSQWPFFIMGELFSKKEKNILLTSKHKINAPEGQTLGKSK